MLETRRLGKANAAAARIRADGAPYTPVSILHTPMDPGLHVTQAVNHLRKVIAYAPYVAEETPDGTEATVALTPEDWGVVADALFHMDTPREVFPAEIADFGLADGGRAIRLSLTDGTVVSVEAG